MDNLFEIICSFKYIDHKYIHMVSWNDIRKHHIEGLFPTLTAAYAYKDKKGYRMKDFDTITDLIDKFREDLGTDAIRNRERLLAEGKGAHVFSGTQIPIIRDLSSNERAQLTKKIERTLDDIEPNGYNPRFIQLHLNNAFRDTYDGPNILGSEDKANIVKLLRDKYESRFIKSAEEARKYKKHIRNLLRREYDLTRNKKNDTKLDDYMKQLKFVEYVINRSNLDGIDLTYTINGRIIDYIQYVMTVCSYEPRIDKAVDDNGVPINCFVACILDQVPEYLRGAKRRRLLALNRPDFTFTHIEQVCKDFGLYVMILDCEGDKWKVYDYRERARKETRNRNIYMVVHNGHAKCLKEEYRLRAAHNTKDGEIDAITLDYVDPYIRSVSDNKRQLKTGTTCKIKMDVDGNKIVSLKIILQRKPYIVVDYKEIEDDYVIYIDGESGILKKYMEFLIEDGIVPVVIGDSTDTIICLSIEIGKHRRILQLRPSISKHDLTDVVPNSHNHTFGSSVMHVFRKRLTQPIMKISDPVIAKVMKHMCRPIIYMKQVNIYANEGRSVYLIDLKRAYRNNCHSLGCFKEPPSFCMNEDFTSRVSGANMLVDGMYELYGKLKDDDYGGRWITRDELVYRLKHGESHLRYRYYIPFTDHTNVLEEFADYIDDDSSIFSEMSPKCRKNAFNILVGKLNPNIDTIKSYAVFKNQIDLDRFLFKGDKKIYRITTLCEDDTEYCMPSWIVEYAYNTDDSYMIGTNASYLSAQIINRCKLTIRKMSDKLREDGCEIIGSMTDSILFAAPSGFDLALDLDKWSIEAYGDSVLSRGVGQYKIYRNGEVIHDRHQGYTSTMNDEFLELMVNLVRRYGRESFSRLDIDEWVNRLADHKLIIGKAGYGKSTYIRQNYSKSEWVRCAYTKLAASEIDGYSICSLFKLGPNGDNAVEHALMMMKNNEMKSMLMRARGLIVDEIYTMPSGVMKRVDQILKFIRGSSLPFGGMDLILCGDDRQTLAIGKSFMNSRLYKKIRDQVERVELSAHDNMRLTYTYDDFCLKFRNPNIHTSDLLDLIQDKRLSRNEVEGYTVYYDNASVNKRNELEIQQYINDHPDAKTVVISDKKYAVGCPIMLLDNYGKGLYNGSLAVLSDVKRDKDDEVSIVIKAPNVEMTRSSTNVCITHAFAMTIHKAQCKTFPGINIYIRRTQINDTSPNSRDTLMRLLYTAMTRVRDFGDCYIEVLD